MKSMTFQRSLSVLILGLMSLAAGGAHAGGDYGRDHRYQSGPDFRQSHQFTREINARQEKQKQRIQAGFHNGALTRFEYRELMRQQADIREMERRFRHDDGLIDAYEFRRLDRALDQASYDIRDEKHDRQARNSFGGHSRYN